MSLDILKEYAPRYKRHEKTGHFLASPHMLGHVFMDWMSAWIDEDYNNEVARKLRDPGYSIEDVKKAFDIFIDKLGEISVKIPDNLRKEALEEYLED